MRKLLSLILVTMLLVGGFVGMFAPAISAYTLSMPVRIDSNADFPTVATVGDGSPGNPWVIENLEIDGVGAGYGIYVGNTTEFFVIRNCSLRNANGFDSLPYYPDSGIVLINVQNGSLMNNTFSGSARYGVYANGSANNTIIHNSFIGNNEGGVQAFDNGMNLWNDIYPSGGNFWSDWITPDNKKGANQDEKGSDGVVDIPYFLDGGVGANDSYPFKNPFGSVGEGDIIIITHDDGDHVEGMIDVRAFATAYNVTGVLFSVDGTPEYYDTGSGGYYRFILDTTKYPEDSMIVITAEAVFMNKPPIDTSVTLIVNNLIDNGDFSVNTLRAAYQPDEAVSVVVTITNSPSGFDKFNMVLTYTDPTGNEFPRNRFNLPPGTTYVTGWGMPSDAVLGSYTLTVSAEAYTNGSLIWVATNTTTFTVAGLGIHEQLANINSTVNVINTLLRGFWNDFNSTWSSWDNRFNNYWDDFNSTNDGLNQTMQGRIASLSTQMTTFESNITLLLNDIDGNVSSIDQNLTNLNNSMEDYFSNIWQEHNDTQNLIGLYWNDWNVTIDQMQSDIDYMNLTIPTLINDLSVQLDSVNNTIINRLTALENNMLINITNSETNILNELAKVNASLSVDINDLLTTITNDISEINSSLSQQLTDLQQDMTTNDAALRTWLELVLEEIDANLTETKQTLADQLADVSSETDTINNTLDNLAKLDTILTDLGTLDIALQEAEVQLGSTIQTASNDELSKINLNTIILVLLLILVIISMVTNLLGKKGRKEASPEKIEHEHSSENDAAADEDYTITPEEDITP